MPFSDVVYEQPWDSVVNLNSFLNVIANKFPINEEKSCSKSNLRVTLLNLIITKLNFRVKMTMESATNSYLTSLNLDKSNKLFLRFMELLLPVVNI